MPRHVDELEHGQPGQQHVHDHAEEEDQRGLGAVVGEHLADDGLVVGHHTLHPEGVLEHVAERGQGAGDDIGAYREDEEADERLDGPLDGVGGDLRWSTRPSRAIRPMMTDGSRKTSRRLSRTLFTDNAFFGHDEAACGEVVGAGFGAARCGAAPNPAAARERTGETFLLFRSHGSAQISGDQWGSLWIRRDRGVQPLP